MSVASFLENPRRSPRVPLRLAVEVSFGSAAWSAVTEDLGPAGCLLVAGRSLVPRTPLALVLRSADAPDRLRVDGLTAWSRGVRCGVSFGQVVRGDPVAWFRRLLESRPALCPAVVRVPDRLPLDARVTMTALPPAGADLPPDERRVLAALRDGVVLGWLALACRLPPARFAAAVFALLERGVLGVAEGRAPQPRPGTLPALAMELLSAHTPHAAPVDRRAGADDRAAAELALGVRGR